MRDSPETNEESISGPALLVRAVFPRRAAFPPDPHSPARRLLLVAQTLLVSATLFACGLPPSFHPAPSDLARGSYARHPSTRPDSLTVVSYNIKYGEHIEQAIDDLRSFETTATADFILLQEMHPEGTQRIARALGYDFVYYPGSIHPKHHRLFGDAILSRWPLLDPTRVILPHHGLFAGTQRIMTMACADVAGDTVLVASIHTATVVTPYDQRMAQVDTAIAALRASPWPVIIGGDFNSVVSRDAAMLRNRFRRAGFHHARLPKGSTIRDKKEFFIAGEPVIDHVFCRGFTVLSTGIISEAKASDHFPIWAILAFDRDDRKSTATPDSYRGAKGNGPTP